MNLDTNRWRHGVNVARYAPLRKTHELAAAQGASSLWIPSHGAGGRRQGEFGTTPTPRTDCSQDEQGGPTVLEPGHLEDSLSPATERAATERAATERAATERAATDTRRAALRGVERAFEQQLRWHVLSLAFGLLLGTAALALAACTSQAWIRWPFLPAIALELTFVPWLLAMTCRRLRRTLALVRLDLRDDSGGDRNERS